MVHAHEMQNADGEDPADDEMMSEEETTDIAEKTAGATIHWTQWKTVPHMKR